MFQINSSKDANLSGIVNDAFTNVSSDVNTSSYQDCNAVSNLTVNTGSVVVPPVPPAKKSTLIKCEFDANNLIIASTANNICTLSSISSDKNVNNLTTSFRNNIAQGIQQNQGNKAGFLGWLDGLLQANVSSGYNTVALSNLISNNVTNDFTEICGANYGATANGLYNVCGKFTGTVDLTASASNINNTTCGAEFISNLIENNSVLNNVNQSITTTQNNLSEGLDSLFKWIAIACGSVVGVIILLAIVAMFTSGRKK